MGSLFVVTVPVRSFEFKLRLKENDLLGTSAVQVDTPDESDPASVLQAFKKQAGDDASMAFPSKDINLPAVKDKVLAFRINHGGKLLMLVTRDTLKLKHVDAVKLDLHNALPNLKGSDTLLNIDQNGGGVGESGRRASISGIQTIDEVEFTDVINNYYLEKHMEDALTKFELLFASWEHSIDENFSQVCFTVKTDMADEIINHLHTVGIGKKYESVLGVCATSVYSEEPRERQGPEDQEEEEKKGKFKEFVQSIKARLTVAQVVQNVKANAVITFDFIVMVVVAGVIAGLGLLESSPVNLIASMLVSPLMGPIMAFTFGAMIRDLSLIKTGVISELIGLTTCWTVGFIFGVSIQAEPFPGPWADVTQWPSSEMYSRAQWRSLWVGAGVATASGAGR